MKESRRRNRLSDPPAFQQEHFGAILVIFCLQIFVVDCIAATTNVFNSFLPADVALCWWSPLSSVPKAFWGCSLSMHWSTCFELFQATTAQRLVSSFNCPKAFSGRTPCQKCGYCQILWHHEKNFKKILPELAKMSEISKCLPTPLFVARYKKVG